MKKSTKAESKNSLFNLIEAYLFYPKLNKAESKGNFASFFDKLANLDESIEHCTLFLNAQSAFQYSRFMNKTHVVLKAYIPHVAIEGSSKGLGLKKGYLTKAHIHGCYPGINNGAVYLENPYFRND